MAGKSEYRNAWIAEKLDRVNLTLPKGKKDAVKAHAAAHGESVNGFIGRAISEAMERDNGGMAPEIAEMAPEVRQGAGVVKSERLGMVHLSPKVLELVIGAAEAAGETVDEFVTRAILEAAKRDKAAMKAVE